MFYYLNSTEVAGMRDKRRIDDRRESESLKESNPPSQDTYSKSLELFDKKSLSPLEQVSIRSTRRMESEHPGKSQEVKRYSPIFDN